MFLITFFKGQYVTEVFQMKESSFMLLTFFFPGWKLETRFLAIVTMLQRTLFALLSSLAAANLGGGKLLHSHKFTAIVNGFPF